MTASFAIVPKNAGSLELLDRTVTDTSGIFLDSEGNDALLPVVAYDEEYVSSSDTEGERRVRSRPSNPQRSGQILVVASNQTDFDARHDLLQQTIEMCRRDGGTIVFSAAGGQLVTVDLETIFIKEVPYDGRLLGAYISRWQFEYQCHPYGKLEDVVIVSGYTSSLPVISVELPNVPGSVPALGRLTITDLASQTRDFVEWGLDTTYDPASPTPVLLDTSVLDTTGYVGALARISGTYSASALKAILLSQPVAVCGLGRQTSTGYRRVRTRVFGAGTGPIWIRLARWLGEKNDSSAVYTATNWVALPDLSAFYDLDLGLVNIPDGQVWGARIEAYSGTPGDLIYVDIAEIIPATRYGKTRAPLVSFRSTGASIAYDTFLQRAGVLTGNALPLGGTWQGAGDPDDFNLTGSRTVTRTAVGDTSSFPNGGRIATASSVSLGAFAAYLEFSASAVGVANQGLIARYSDLNNFLAIYVMIATSGQSTLTAIFRSAGSYPAQKSVPCGYLGANAWYQLAAVGDSSGNVFAWMGASGTDLGEPILKWSSGFFGSGPAGILDVNPTATPCTRTYRNFIVPAAPLSHHAIESGKALQVLSDSVSHQPASGTAWARPPYYSGSYLLIPPGESRLAIKCRRTDDDGWIDSGLTDNTQVDVSVTPRVALL